MNTSIITHATIMAILLLLITSGTTKFELTSIVIMAYLVYWIARVLKCTFKELITTGCVFFVLSMLSAVFTQQPATEEQLFIIGLEFIIIALLLPSRLQDAS